MRSVYDGGEWLAPCHARRLLSLPFLLLFCFLTLSEAFRGTRVPSFSSCRSFSHSQVCTQTYYCCPALSEVGRSTRVPSLSSFLSMMIVLSTDTLVCSLSCIPRRSPAVACSHPILQRNQLSFEACMMETYRYFGNTQLLVHLHSSSAVFGSCMFAPDYAS
jgi:hypothetical protein